MLAVIAALSGTQYVKANTFDIVEVYKDGKLIGEVGSQQQVEQLIDSKQAELKASHPDVNMVLDTGKITYGRKSAYKAKPDSDSTLNKLAGLLTAHATGVELKVNGKVVGIVKDQATADSILQRVENKYVPRETAKKNLAVTTLSYTGEGSNAKQDASKTELKSVKIVDQVGTEETSIQPGQIADPNEVYLKLVQGTVKPTKYTVQDGDCIGCIAEKFDISPQVIYERNPWIQDDMIKVGDVLDLTVLKPEVTVQTVENVTETETVDPQTVIQKNSNMRAGETKVIREGKSGKKKVVYKLTKQNGYLMSEELLGEQVLVPSIPAIVMKGTKVILGEGTGHFSWPVSGARLTSSFGKRWGRLHKGIDMVGNKNIKAADNGVIEFAGQKTGYGNCVIINHRNGYETLYGHMSKILVKKGQTVEKGEQIGIMGNTGHSTGTHLHFEVHKNGDLQNPIKYL
ncbi:M23 family metallopeptidase [Paenibacillus humicola]|uniref:M23 family metallopeptidase n=1 Tax=Paenibacillus humicola TaxID=3110540 RepID=UPI00237B08C4|nr:M23 family metallopeptidase [Paenibacillus humicola]